MFSGIFLVLSAFEGSGKEKDCEFLQFFCLFHWINLPTHEYSWFKGKCLILKLFILQKGYWSNLIIWFQYASREQIYAMNREREYSWKLFEKTFCYVYSLLFILSKNKGTSSNIMKIATLVWSFWACTSRVSGVRSS